MHTAYTQYTIYTLYYMYSVLRWNEVCRPMLFFLGSKDYGSDLHSPRDRFSREGRIAHRGSRPASGPWASPAPLFICWVIWVNCYVCVVLCLWYCCVDVLVYVIVYLCCCVWFVVFGLLFFVLLVRICWESPAPCRNMQMCEWMGV